VEKRGRSHGPYQREKSPELRGEKKLVIISKGKGGGTGFSAWKRKEGGERCILPFFNFGGRESVLFGEEETSLAFGGGERNKKTPNVMRRKKKKKSSTFSTCVKNEKETRCSHLKGRRRKKRSTTANSVRLPGGRKRDRLSP